MSLSLNLTQDASNLLTSCRDLRDLYSRLRGRSPASTSLAQRALGLADQITTLSGDTAINRDIVQFRDRTSQPFSFKVRHRILHNLSNQDGAWQFEMQVLPQYGIDEHELKHLREEARKHFAEMERSSQVFDHPLAGPMPLAELAYRLNTRAIVTAGDGRFLLGRKQKMLRNARVREDTQLLAAIILILANSGQRGERVFELSYSLAVGEYCLA